MQIVSFFNIYDSYFENKKEKIISKLKKDIETQKFSYPMKEAKLDLCISLISKIYNINEKVLKDRLLAHELNAIDDNYREACGMLYFICLKNMKWSWNAIVEYFKTNKYCIYTYVTTFEESKEKSLKEKYMYVISKVEEVNF